MPTKLKLLKGVRTEDYLPFVQTRRLAPRGFAFCNKLTRPAATSHQGGGSFRFNWKTTYKSRMESEALRKTRPARKAPIQKVTDPNKTRTINENEERRRQAAVNLFETFYPNPPEQERWIPRQTILWGPPKISHPIPMARIRQLYWKLSFLGYVQIRPNIWIRQRGIEISKLAFNVYKQDFSQVYIFRTLGLWK